MPSDIELDEVEIHKLFASIREHIVDVSAAFEQAVLRRLDDAKRAEAGLSGVLGHVLAQLFNLAAGVGIDVAADADADADKDGGPDVP